MKLTPVERHALRHLFLEGPDVPANIADPDVYDDAPHRNSVSRSLRNLEDKGLVEDRGHGVHRLTRAGMQAARMVVDESSWFG